MNVVTVLRAGSDLAEGSSSRLTRGVILGVVAQLFTVASLVLAYLGLRDLIEGDATLERALWLSAGMLTCYLIRLVLEAESIIDVSTGATDMLAIGRNRMLEHLRRLPMGYYSDARTGELTQAVTGDLDTVHNLWSQATSGISKTLALAAFTALAIVFIDWRLALVCMATLPLALWALSWSQQVLATRGDQLVAAMGDLSARLLEYTQGIRVLRVFQLTGRRMSTLIAALAQYHQLQRRAELGVSSLVLLYYCVLELSFTVMIVTGALLFTNDRVDGLTYIGVLFFGVAFYRPMADTASYFLRLRFAYSSMGRIRGVLDAPPQTSKPEQVALESFEVEFDRVNFSYDPGVPVLSDFSLRLEPGTTTALVGSSGSGKSTVANLLLRFWDATEGAVRVGGVDLRELDFDHLNQHIATVFQDVYLFRDTVANNIRIGKPGATDEEVVAAAKRARCHEFVTAMPDGYDSLVGEGGATLSGGERQRVSIARALLKDAPILILDEATASVDLDNEAQIQQALLEFRGNRTVLVVAHRLWTIRDADQIVVMDRGTIAERGTHDELLHADGRYTELWRRQEGSRGWRLTSSPDATPIAADAAQTGEA